MNGERMGELGTFTEEVGLGIFTPVIEALEVFNGVRNRWQNFYPGGRCSAGQKRGYTWSWV